MKIEIFLIITFFAISSLANVSALSATVHIPEKYNEVNAGDRLYFELAIRYPENPTRVDLRLEYEVVDENGEVITQAKALKAVETQASFLDFIILPEEMDYGRYDVNVYIKDYGNLSEKVGSSFNVGRNRVDILFTYIYLLAAAICILMIMIIIVLFRRAK